MSHLTNSPKLTGSPTAPTPPVNDSSTRLATTEFVGQALVTASPAPSSAKYLVSEANANLANALVLQSGVGTSLNISGGSAKIDIKYGLVSDLQPNGVANAGVLDLAARADHAHAFSATGPLSYSGGVLSIQLANGTQAGALSAADWTNFNSKQAALGFTPINKAGDSNVTPFTLTSDPTLPMHPATKQYVDNVSAGLKDKGSVLVLAPSNVTLATPGATIDGVTMAAGDKFLAPNQTNATENGIYVWNGASVAATRASNADSWLELVSAYVWIEKGSSADQGWHCISDQGGTLGTTSVTWTQFSASTTIQAGSGLTKTGNSLALTTVTANRALVSDATGLLSASTTTSTELGYLSGVTSSIQTQLTSKAPVDSPEFTGTPKAPTASSDTNTTQIATTAFVLGQASSTNPANLGVVAVGSSYKYARADHAHAFSATDPLSWNGTVLSLSQATGSTPGYLSSADWTTFNAKAPTNSPTFTGTPIAPTAAVGTNTTQLATTAFVLAQQKFDQVAITTKTAAYTLVATDQTILADATSGIFTLNLPAAPVIGQTYDIKKIDSSANIVTVSGNGATIDGSASIQLIAQWQAYTLKFNGTSWFCF